MPSGYGTRSRLLRGRLAGFGVLLLVLTVDRTGRADGVAQVLTNKTLPACHGGAHRSRDGHLQRRRHHRREGRGRRRHAVPLQVLPGARQDRPRAAGLPDRIHPRQHRGGRGPHRRRERADHPAALPGHRRRRLRRQLSHASTTCRPAAAARDPVARLDRPDLRRHRRVLLRSPRRPARNPGNAFLDAAERDGHEPRAAQRRGDHQPSGRHLADPRPPGLGLGPGACLRDQQPRWQRQRQRRRRGHAVPVRLAGGRAPDPLPLRGQRAHGRDHPVQRHRRALAAHPLPRRADRQRRRGQRRRAACCA